MHSSSTVSNALSTMLIRCKLVSKVHRSPHHASIVPDILFSTDPNFPQKREDVTRNHHMCSPLPSESNHRGVQDE